LSLLVILFISSCDDNDIQAGLHFDSDLQGTWVSNDPAIYSGTLIISTNRITIIGFHEGQTPSRGDDNNRPFKNFTKGTALKGYSEEKKLFIEDGGLLQEGIPYVFYKAGNSSEDSFIRFTFGNRMEIMQKQKN